MNAQHSAKSCEHGSPAALVELARYTLGSIDLDPASSSYWNTHVVKATRFYDQRVNGLKQPWAGNVWLNPPGADEGAGRESLVRPFWERLCVLWWAGEVQAAVFYGFSLEQLQVLQSSGWDPLRCVTLVLDQRQAHMARPRGGGAPVAGTSPTHGNFATLLTSRRFRSTAEQQIGRFRERGQKLGRIVRPL